MTDELDEAVLHLSRKDVKKGMQCIHSAYIINNSLFFFIDSKKIFKYPTYFFYDKGINEL